MDFQKKIEKAARKTFKILFSSRLYMQKKHSIQMNGLLGVDLDVSCDGTKKMSLYMEKKTVESIMKEPIDPKESSSTDSAYDIIGELANMIAGNALPDREDVYISGPKRKNIHRGYESGNSMNFSCPMGKFAIVIEDS